jgi:hypothetical protein
MVRQFLCLSNRKKKTQQSKIMLNSKAYASFTPAMFAAVPAVDDALTALNAALVEPITTEKLYECYQSNGFYAPNLGVDTASNSLTLDFKGTSLALSKKAKLSPQAIATVTNTDGTSHSGDIWIGAKGKGFLLNCWYSQAGADADLTDVLVPALRTCKAAEVIAFLAITLRKVDQPGKYSITDIKTSSTSYGAKSATFKTTVGDIRVVMSPSLNATNPEVIVDDHAIYQLDPASIVGLTGVSIPGGFADINKDNAAAYPAGTKLTVLAIANRLQGNYGAESFALFQAAKLQFWGKVADNVAYYWLALAAQNITETGIDSPQVEVEVVAVKQTKKGNNITSYRVIHSEG